MCNNNSVCSITTGSSIRAARGAPALALDGTGPREPCARWGVQIPDASPIESM